MGKRQLSPRARYYVIYAILLACTYLTWQIADFDLGAFNTVAALGIAGIKATLVVIFFMHVREGSRLNAVVWITGLFWLVILVALTMADYLTRDWLT